MQREAVGCEVMESLNEYRWRGMPGGIRKQSDGFEETKGEKEW